jgi:hypothetical protein
MKCYKQSLVKEKRLNNTWEYEITNNTWNCVLHNDYIWAKSHLDFDAIKQSYTELW